MNGFGGRRRALLRGGTVVPLMHGAAGMALLHALPARSQVMPPQAQAPQSQAAQAQASLVPVPRPAAQPVTRFRIADARQAVAVDATSFYAIDNRVIARHDKKTGALLQRWEGERDGPIVHLDSGTVIEGRLYTAHSNYPAWPMTSSIEIWDAATLQHVGTHSFGIDRGSFTWLDRDRDGVWWGAFANYNRVFDRSPIAYGNKFMTQLVRFGAGWRVEQAWVFPDRLIERFADMSNSGGSFGPDGRLYVSAHDNAELYVVEVPKMGSTLRWVGTQPIDLNGQGFAFDRSEPGLVYGIVRRAGANSEVTVNRLPAG